MKRPLRRKLMVKECQSKDCTLATRYINFDSDDHYVGQYCEEHSVLLMRVMRQKDDTTTPQ